MASPKGLTPGEIHKAVEKFVGKEGGGGGLKGFTHDQLAKFFLDAEVEDSILATMIPADKGSKLRYVLEKSTPEGQARILDELLDCYRTKRYKWRFSSDEDEKERMRLAPVIERMIEGLRTGVTLVEAPKVSKSAIVHQALKEAQTLLRSHGDGAALDRVHTALMGYMQEALSGAAIAFSPNASAMELYGLLREKHPAFELPAEVSSVGHKLYRSIGAALEAFNTMRNDWSRAHPGKQLPRELASVGLDFAMTVLRDLDRRLSHQTESEAVAPPVAGAIQ